MYIDWLILYILYIREALNCIELSHFKVFNTTISHSRKEGICVCVRDSGTFSFVPSNLSIFMLPSPFDRTPCTAWWASGIAGKMQVQIQPPPLPCHYQRRPHILATSINDWFKDEASDVEPENDLQDGPARFLGLAGRVGVVLARTAKAGSRYIAYSSDVGEAFRPLVSPAFVRATYGIAYAYVLADVGFAVYGEHNRSADKADYDQRVARAGVETLTFQLLASIAVPSLIIHTAVHQAQKIAKRATKPTKLARYGPTALGLAIIPVLPFTIDSPIEHFIEEGFDTFWPLEGFRQGHESATDGVISTGGDGKEEAPVATGKEEAPVPAADEKGKE